MVKYFDSNWEEVAPEKAVYAIKLEVDKDGTVISSEVYIVEK